MFSISYWWSRWWSPLESTICVIDPTKTYTESSRARFLQFLAANGGSVPISANIDPVVYDKLEFHKVLMDGDNMLEKIWRARVLVECVPVAGNIVMFYDIFKQGFSYYCDQPVVAYDVLNSVAMKYVERFKCVDFFLDEYVVGSSPLKAVFMGEEVKKPVVGVAVDVKTGPFAKLKNYATVGATRPIIPKTPVYFRTKFLWFWKLWYRVRYYFVVPIWHFGDWCLSWVWKPRPVVMDSDTKPVKDIVVKEPEKIRNKFIYLGRFRNLQLLQLPVKKGVFGGGSTKYDAMFKCGKGVSYKDFKLSGGSGGSGAAAF